MPYKVTRNGLNTGYPNKVQSGEMTPEQFLHEYREPGDILYAVFDKPTTTIFKTQEEAEEAIDRSIAFGESNRAVISDSFANVWCSGYEIIEV